MPAPGNAADTGIIEEWIAAGAPEDRCAWRRANRFDMREIAAFVLGQLGTPKCPYANESFPILATLADDPYFEVRCAATAALGSLASLGHPPPPAIGDRIVKASTDDASDVRAAAAFSLGCIESTYALKALRKLSVDTDSGVRDAAEFGLEMHAERKPSRKKAGRPSPHRQA